MRTIVTEPCRMVATGASMMQGVRQGDMLLDQHDICLRPSSDPTGPRGTERLRITPTPLHTDKTIFELRHARVSVWAGLELPREWPTETFWAARSNRHLAVPGFGG